MIGCNSIHKDTFPGLISTSFDEPKIRNLFKVSNVFYNLYVNCRIIVKFLMLLIAFNICCTERSIYNDLNYDQSDISTNCLSNSSAILCGFETMKKKHHVELVRFTYRSFSAK